MSDPGPEVVDLVVRGQREPLQLDKIGRLVPHLLFGAAPKTLSDRVALEDALKEWSEAIRGWCKQTDAIQQAAALRRQRVFVHIQELLRYRFELRLDEPSKDPAARAWLKRLASAHAANRLRVPVAVDWGGHGAVAILELLLNDEAIDGEASVHIHPADAFLYASAYETLAVDMRQAFDLACSASNRHANKQAYWRFLNAEGLPLASADHGPPQGDSATGAAFYGWCNLLAPDGRVGSKAAEREKQLSELVLARIAEGDLKGFAANLEDTDNRTTLETKARAIARAGFVTRVITASDVDAQIVHETLKAERGGRIKVVHL
jgi:hypothetical protein